MPKSHGRIDSYYAGAYWGPRKETPEACARRAEAFLAAIAKLDPAFSRWFEGGRSRQDALKRPIEPVGEALEKRVRRGRVGSSRTSATLSGRGMAHPTTTTRAASTSTAAVIAKGRSTAVWSICQPEDPTRSEYCPRPSSRRSSEAWRLRGSRRPPLPPRPCTVTQCPPLESRERSRAG